MLIKRSWRALFIACATALIFVPGFACAASASDNPAATRGVLLDGTVAIVNDSVVLQSQLRRGLQRATQQLTQRGTQVPPANVLRHQVLQRLISVRLQLDRADQMGISISNNELNQTLTRIAQQRGYKLSEMPAKLAAEGISYNQFRKEIRRELTLRRVQQKAVASRVTVTPAEVQHFLVSQAKQGRGNTRYHVYQILVKVSPSASDKTTGKAKQRALTLYKKLNDGANFQATAAADSDGRHALDDGDLGWLSGAEIPTSLADTILTMDVGDISKPIKDNNGYHILKLAAKRDQHKVIITQTHARHILIKPDLLINNNEAQKRLKDIRSKILHGASFAKLAEKYSDDGGSAEKGGDLGWVNPGQLVPKFEKVMDSLKVNQISAPFQTRFGWHIVQVQARRKQNQTKQVQRRKAYAAIHKRKMNEQMARWLQQLHDEAYIKTELNGNDDS